MATGSPSVFPPLDPAERLPREQLQASTPGGLEAIIPHRHLRRPEVLASVIIPAFILVGVIVGEYHFSFLVGAASFIALGLTFALLAFFWAHPQPRPRPSPSALPRTPSSV